MAIVLLLAALSRRVGRLSVRPQDAKIVRWVTRGTLHSTQIPIGIGLLASYVIWALGASDLPRWTTGATALVSFATSFFGHWWLSRIDHPGPVDPSLERSARVFFGIPLGATALASLFTVAILLAALASPELASYGSAGLPWAATTVVFGVLAVWLSFSYFIFPVAHRQPDGTVSSVGIGELWRRWKLTANGGTAAPPVEPAASSAEPESDEADRNAARARQQAAMRPE